MPLQLTSKQPVNGQTRCLLALLLWLGLVYACLIGPVPAQAFSCPPIKTEDVLIEAESFADLGGWKLDTQFIDNMGSPYLLAHGLGQPVADARTETEFDQTGTYHLYVRTFDWVKRWNAPGQPGRFQVLINGEPVQTTFGTEGGDWGWQYGGQIEINHRRVDLALRDLTGFDGRVDAILFSKQKKPPANDSAVLPKWRRDRLGLSDKPTELSPYDLVVVGGGYSGMGAAISAARMGCRVALIQNRPVLGGNGSSEVRVWSMGLIRRGKYPRIGEIVAEFADAAKKSPGSYEEFEDAKKERIVRAEKNIDLFLNHHAYQVKKEGDQIKAITAFSTKTSEHKTFSGKLFVDCTGHGTLGHLAGAEHDTTPKGRMGMSNMWAWAEKPKPTQFPDTSTWALDLEMKDFPYPRDFHGQWFWESGFDKDPIGDAEAIRDWNLRAVYGAFNAMKNRDGADKHQLASLTWVAYIGGPRESRRLLGDVVLTQEDIVQKREFKDGCVPSTWSIDLHYPKKQYSKKFPDNPFISIAKHDRRVDRSFGYPVPYRCFYSANVSNLFMAGRCSSVTHEALGTVRVMKTCGMMGEVVGRAASICIQKSCKPRDVYQSYYSELDALMKLPGKARREHVNAPIEVPDNAMPAAGSFGPITGVNPSQLDGQVVDDTEATKVGQWTAGTNLKGYVGWSYLYASPDSGATAQFQFNVPADGQYEVRLTYRHHENRGDSVPIEIEFGLGSTLSKVDMTKPVPEIGFQTLLSTECKKGDSVTVKVGTEEAGGFVCIDAVQLIRIQK